MATHSSTFAWKIPWTEEPGGLQSMGSWRVRHDWVASLSLFHFPALEKEMATHSSVPAWRIPGTEELSGLPSMGSHRVGHDWSDLAGAAAGNYDNACHSATKEKKKEKKFIPQIKEYKEVLEINNTKANISPNGQRLKDTWKTVMNGQYANVTSLQNIEN